MRILSRTLAEKVLLETFDDFFCFFLKSTLWRLFYKCQVTFGNKCCPVVMACGVPRLLRRELKGFNCRDVSQDSSFWMPPVIPRSTNGNSHARAVNFTALLNTFRLIAIRMIFRRNSYNGRFFVRLRFIPCGFYNKVKTPTKPAIPGEACFTL